MTKVLASVRNREEAAIALHADIGVLDLKDPAQGALGALPADTVKAIADTVGGRVLVSAVLGDLPPDLPLIQQKLQSMSECRLDYIKMGFFGSSYLSDILPFLQKYASIQPMVGVLIVEHFTDFVGPCRLLHAAGFKGAMLDTENKNSTGLTSICSREKISSFVRAARQLGLVCGLAGSLTVEDIPALLPLHPTYLGFRTALCEDLSRTQTLSANRLQAVCQAVNTIRNSS